MRLIYLPKIFTENFMFRTSGVVVKAIWSVVPKQPQNMRESLQTLCRNHIPKSRRDD